MRLRLRSDAARLPFAGSARDAWCCRIVWAKADVCAAATHDIVKLPVPAKNSSPQKSRRFSNVPVVKPTDFWELNDPSQFRALDGPRLRGVALQPSSDK